MPEIHRRSTTALHLLCASLAAAVMAAAVPAAHAQELAQTPPMGWNDWNAFHCHITGRDVRRQAHAIVQRGLKAAGYRYVVVDDCWMAKQRTKDGRLRADPQAFPKGMKRLAADVHHLGLKFGLYEDAGNKTCAGRPGSYGHYRTDARTFASWRVDYLKFDWCNVPDQGNGGLHGQQLARHLYRQMHLALRATDRPIVFAICNWGWYQPWLWAPRIGNTWRTTGDISPTFGDILHHFYTNIWLGRYAGPGHWNNPDMLEIGNGDLTLREERTEFSLWAMMASPLMLGSNITKLSKAELAVITNPGVVAIDQDKLGAPAWIVSAKNGHDVIARHLSGGDYAVLFLNETGNDARIDTTGRIIGIPAATKATAVNLWSRKRTPYTGSLAATVPAHGVRLYRIDLHRGTPR